jgi:fructose-2,6-bisphosphatase
MLCADFADSREYTVGRSSMSEQNQQPKPDQRYRFVSSHHAISQRFRREARGARTRARGAMYGFGMMPQYAGFPQQQQGFAHGPFIGVAGGQHVVRPKTVSSFPASTPSGPGGSPSKAPQPAHSAAAGRSKTPTPSVQPKYVNTLQMQQQQGGTAGARAGQPATASGVGRHGLNQSQMSSTPSVPMQRGGPPALAPQQQTQATPSGMNQVGQGGRRHWPLELWVVRHGETIENNTRVIAGQNASGLTEHGQEQANLLSTRLQDVEFAGIYISDLNRTKQTADAVLRKLGPGVPAFTDSRLREKGAGQYEGYKIGYIEHMTRLSGQPHRVFRPPGGESWEDVASRSRSFMREILHRYCVCSDQNGRPLSHRGYDASGRGTPVMVSNHAAPLEPKRILIVTHGGFISEFLSSAVGGVPNCAKNCSIFVLACARDHPRARTQFYLKTINEVAHVRTLATLKV